MIQSLFLLDIGPEDYIAKLIPNWTSFVVQLCGLIVMLIVVILIGYKPVKKMLKKRQDYIESSVRDAQVNKVQAERDRVQANEMIIASKKQASEIIANAEKEANLRKDEMIANTNQVIQKMKRDAQADIEQSRKDALEDIHDEIVSVALMASSEVLKREINEKDNARIVKDFIKEME